MNVPFLNSSINRMCSVTKRFFFLLLLVTVRSVHRPLFVFRITNEKEKEIEMRTTSFKSCDFIITGSSSFTFSFPFPLRIEIKHFRHKTYLTHSILSPLNRAFLKLKFE